MPIWTKNRILKSTTAPKLSELATNTYSLPWKIEKDASAGKIIPGTWANNKMITKGIKRPTCDNNRSSLPLFFRDGNTSPWPGGYLHVHTIIMSKKNGALHEISLDIKLDSYQLSITGLRCFFYLNHYITMTSQLPRKIKQSSVKYASVKGNNVHACSWSLKLLDKEWIQILIIIKNKEKASCTTEKSFC